MYAIRAARPRELAELDALEDAADQRYHGAGLGHLIEGATRSPAEFAEACAEGRLFVADDGLRPVGFALVTLVDGGPHLHELSVHPDHGRRGLGRRLLEFVCAWARARGFRTLTLTTFRDVPWNGPFYRRAGFRVVPEQELGPGLRALRADEAAQGLDPGIRDVMRRELGDR